MTNEDDYVDLLQELQRQQFAAVGMESDQVQADQIEAFERYTRQNYGDEQTGRSQVHTAEVFETIEWLRPDIARMFGAGGKAVEIEPWAEGSEEEAEQATDYLTHSFFEQMDGHAIIDSFFFDGALQKIGVVGVYWQDATLDEPEEYEGLDEVQAHEMAEDPSVDVLEAEQLESGAIRMSIQRVREEAKPYCEVIAPEDFRVSSRAVDLEDVAYCGRQVRTTASELKLLFPDKVDKIDEYADSSREDVDTDERRSERFWDEDGIGHALPTDALDDNDVILHEEYLHWDLDEDGYDELIEVKRLDACILSAQPVEEHPFACWSPIRIPHKLIGMSIADITKDIQKTQTVLLRAALDATYQAVAPRMAVMESKVNLADLLTVRPGGAIRIKEGVTRASDALMPITVPDVSPSALQMMEKVDRLAETRTGVTRHAQGLDPDALNKTATGIKLLQNAASARKEMIARNFASGLEVMFRKFYRLMVRNQQRPQHVRIGKMWQTFTPSTWDAESRVRVFVGNGTGDRETQLNQLMMLLSLQEKAVAALGVGNPLVTPKHMHNTMEEMARVIGYRSTDQFFADPAQVPPEQMQQLMAPKPSPEMAKVEAQAQADQAKLQMQQQSDAAKMQMEQAGQQHDAALKREQLMMEIELKREQMGMEIQLKREQLAAELALKREIESVKVERGYYDKPAVNGSGKQSNGSSPVHMGGDPG